MLMLSSERCYVDVVGNCSYHALESECVGSVQGRSCVWRSGRCVALSDLDPSDSGGRSCDPSEGRYLLKVRIGTKISIVEE